MEDGGEESSVVGRDGIEAGNAFVAGDAATAQAVELCNCLVRRLNGGPPTPGSCARCFSSRARRRTGEIRRGVEAANDDDRVHAIVLAGAVLGYDLKAFAEARRGTRCKVHGCAVAGGSDIAFCADVAVMAEDARIGYMPTRVRGCPTTAMWVCRRGAEKTKRMLLVGDTIDGRTAKAWGLVCEAVPANKLDAEAVVQPPRRGARLSRGGEMARQRPCDSRFA